MTNYDYEDDLDDYQDTTRQLSELMSGNNYFYAYTLTFKPFYTIKQKFRIIKYVVEYCRRFGDVAYCIEYHKYNNNHPLYKKGCDNSNPLRPHIHIMLGMRKQFSGYSLDYMNKDHMKYGRRDIKYLESEHDVKKWYTYIYKDVVQNNNRFSQIQHYGEFEKEKPVITYVEKVVQDGFMQRKEKEEIKVMKELSDNIDISTEEDIPEEL